VCAAHPLLSIFTNDTSTCELAPAWQSELRKLADVHANYDGQILNNQLRWLRLYYTIE
jgi:hypothetical protein